MGEWEGDFVDVSKTSQNITCSSANLSLLFFIVFAAAVFYYYYHYYYYYLKYIFRLLYRFCVLFLYT